MCFCMNSPAASSASAKYGAAQPPYVKPSDVSSSGLPGACMTPSKVINDRTIIFLMKSTPYQLLGDGRKAMPPGLSYGSRIHVSATKLCAFLLCSAPHDEGCSLSEHSMRARKKLLRSCSF